MNTLHQQRISGTRSLRRTATAAVASACYVAMLVTAHSALLVSDGFEYGLGELNGQNGGQGFSGAWAAAAANTQVVAPGLSYNANGVSHNGGGFSLELSGRNDSAASRSFAQAINADSFLVSVLVNVPISSGTPDNNDFAAGWFDQYGGLGFGLKVNEGVGGSRTLDLFARVKLDSHDAAYSTAIELGKTYLLVAKFSKTTAGASSPYNMAEIWVNPGLNPGAANAFITETGTSGLSTSVSKLGFRTANLDGDDKVLYDMLMIGEKMSDVVVPEPTTLLAGALLLVPLGLSTLRKRLKA